MNSPPRDWSESETQAGGATAVRAPSSGSGSATPAPGSAGKSAETSTALLPGTVLGDRYEIIQLLGEGGMGAVYKAHDRELGRTVALKTIRAEFAGSADMLQRFKQEIILAREITHPNVVRIYDIGDAAGLKFITMEFVDGEDLHTALQERGRFSPPEAADTIRQVCAALVAAHQQGVIHRDLKPQNVMRDRQGRVVVLDFGLARTLGTDSMTQSGALVGTMAYMSPEQALGEKLDARSDLFALGLIFFELLTGRVPYKADSVLGSLLKRSQAPAEVASDIDPRVPIALSRIVARCLERDRNARYASAEELLRDLETWQSPAAAPAAVPRRIPVQFLRPRKWISLAVAAFMLVLAGVGIRFRHELLATPPGRQEATPALSVAFLPLRNASGDPSMDWLGSSVAEILGTDIGQSSQLRTVPSDRLHQTLQDLRVGPDSHLDDATLRRVASFTNANVIVWGQYVRLGNRLRLDLTLQDLKNDRTLPIKAEAANESELGATVDRIAQSVRTGLSLSADVVQELQASAFKPSTSSIAALRAYNQGLDFLRHGKSLEAQQALAAATNDDPQFALAFSKLAQAYANLGYGDQAEQASRRAVELSGSLPPAEKYQIMAEHARSTKDFAKAIEAYRNLAKVLPQDTDVEYALARLYEDTRSTDKAREQYEKLLKRDPNYVDALLGMGRVQLLRGDAQASLDYLNRALGLAVQLGNGEQKASALFFLGTAFFMLNQPGDSLRNFQDSLDLRRARADKGGTALTLNSMAQVQQELGQSAQALQSYQEALRLRRAIGDKHGIGNTLLDLSSFFDSRGQYDQALEMAKQSLQIQRDMGDPLNQAACLNNIGWVYLEKADYENAIAYLQQALELREKLKDQGAIADTLYNLADASAKMGQYDPAVNYYLRALQLWRQVGDKRGLATADYGLGILFAYQGRFGAALNAEADAFKNFSELNERGTWLAQIQGGYGNALALIGRDQEADKNLKEALNLARQLKNESLTAYLLNSQGERLFNRGEYKSARSLFEQALARATRARDRADILAAKLGLVKVAVRDGRPRDALQILKGLADEADKAGMKYLSIECSGYRAEALVSLGNYPMARAELDRVMSASEKLNLSGVLARSHYLLATLLRQAGNSQEASRHYAEAYRLLEEIHKEAGTDDILKRSDFAAMYSESSRWSQPRK